ncbi:hypothetical protein [Roseovarius salis]
MKTRWMKSLIKTSKEPMPSLPFRRGARGAKTTQTAALRSA